MVLSHGPRVVTDGLVLALDAADINSFDEYENLWTYSEQFDNGAWGKNQVTVTANQGIAPDGTLTADLVTTNTVSAYNTLDQFPTLSTNTNYCYSVFVKLVSGSGTSSRVVLASANDQVSPVYASWGLQLDTLAETSDGNTPTVKGYIPYPNGWYRLYMVINTSGQTNPSVGIRFGTGGADTVNTFYVWGAQLEKANAPTDYYATTGTAKTRGSTWIDLSGNSNNGTLTNGPTYNISNGGSIVFDGTNDYVNLGNILNFTTESFTFNVWFYLSNFIPSDPIQGPILFYKGQFQSNGYYCQFGQNGSINFVTNQNTTYQVSGTAAGIVSLNTWYCLSLVRSGSNITIYVNGNQSSSSNSHINPTSSSDSFLLCSYNFGIYSNFRISQFYAYNKALTATEIQQNFNATRSRFNI